MKFQCFVIATTTASRQVLKQMPHYRASCVFIQLLMVSIYLFLLLYQVQQVKSHSKNVVK